MLAAAKMQKDPVAEAQIIGECPECGHAVLGTIAIPEHLCARCKKPRLEPVHYVAPTRQDSAAKLKQTLRRLK